MTAIASSAPGKLVILGEYAVLFGHPAVVMAVNRRARVDLRPADGNDWSVVAPGFEERVTPFDLDRDRGFEWREPAADAPARLVLVERILDSLVAANLIDPEIRRPASITVDTREFFQSTERGSAKLGLGSSAALTVALTKAFRSWAPQGQRSEAVSLGQLLDLHRSFQGGRGSGIDLAASFTGGVVEYRLIEDGQTPSARPLDLPKGLHLVFLWTGRSASTASFLARLDQGVEKDGGATSAAIDELGRVASEGIAHLRADDVTAFLGDVSVFGDTMERLGRAAGIPILSDEHIELRRLARDIGVSYKPSGAGGGDVGIGFTDDPEDATVFAARAEDAGFPQLDLEIDPEGVRQEFLILNS